MRVSDNQSLPINQGMELVLKKTDRRTEPNVTFMRTCINEKVDILDNRYTTKLEFREKLSSNAKEEYCAELQQWVTLLNEVRSPLSMDKYGSWGANHVTILRTILVSLLAREMQIGEVM